MTHKSEDYKISAVKYYLKNITPYYYSRYTLEKCTLIIPLIKSLIITPVSKGGTL
jgi:hypothetical protein